MKKFLLLLFAACLTSGMYAQTKKISRVEVYENDDVTPLRIYDFHYDEYGRMLGSDWKVFSGWGAGETGNIRLTYSDADNTIKIEDFEKEPDLDWTVAYVENGRITRLDASYGEEDMCISYLTYNSEGELTAFSNYAFDMIYYDGYFKWHNGNMMNQEIPDYSSGTYTLSNYDRPASLPFFMELIDYVGDFDLPNPFYYLPDYLGKRPKKLLTGYSDRDSKFTYSYKFDAEGNVSEIISEIDEGTWYKGIKRIVCSYTTVSGINDVPVNRHDNHKAIYNAAGHLRPDMNRGLNIVKTADGAVRKVVVK